MSSALLLVLLFIGTVAGRLHSRAELGIDAAGQPPEKVAAAYLQAIRQDRAQLAAFFTR